MNTNISDVAIKPIKVQPQPHERKSSATSKRLSKQGSISTNSASEVYYGDSNVSVPFRWESSPGTPKINMGERRPLPPLTPPPSYLSSPARKSVKKHHSEDNYTNSGGILHNALPKINLIRKSPMHSLSVSSSSSSSSSSSVSSSPWSSSRSVRSSPCTPEPGAGRRKLAFHLGRKDADEDDVEDEEEHLAKLCFGIAGRSNTTKRGCSANFIKLLLGQHA